MALRVLLADESVTIKKVFQLSLQDFGVDVFAVTSGLDVLPVAKKNRPDILFVDVILPKKSGYDVAKEIKNDPDLKNVPVVIIWSGFMELDQARFVSCGADAHLEKPFDTQKLRHIVQSLVKKTGTQTLSEFLQFPKLPDFRDEAPTQARKQTPAAPEDTNVLSMRTKSTPQEKQSGDWNMDHFAPMPSGTSITQVNEPAAEPESNDGDFSELADDFVPVDLPPPQAPSRASAKRSEAIKQWTAPEASNIEDDQDADADADSDNQWIQKTLSRYKVDAADTEELEPEIEYQEPSGKIDAEAIIRNERSAPPNLPPKPASKAAPKATPKTDFDASPEDDGTIELDLGEATETRSENIPQLTDKQLEAIIRAQSKEMIEKVIWQVVPEIAAQIIEREIQRLLKERQDIGPR